MDREHEIWAMALWVEKHHGDDGERYIREQVSRNERENEAGGVTLWQAVAQRHARLKQDAVPRS